jgi:WD repeat-containing protein 45
LVSLCPDSSSMVLACPGINKGHVTIELYDIRKTTLIPAHESDLAQLALNTDGTKVATASDKGTLIRVFDTNSGELLQELRRGMDRADITSICFNQTSTFIACCSDRGTVHIFTLGNNNQQQLQQQQQHSRQRSDSSNVSGNNSGNQLNALSNSSGHKNTKSGLSFLGGLLPIAVPKYFSSEWSYAQVSYTIQYIYIAHYTVVMLLLVSYCITCKILT